MQEYEKSLSSSCYRLLKNGLFLAVYYIASICSMSKYDITY